MVTVRPAEPADVPAVRAVAERAWRAAHEPVVGAAAVDAFLAEFYDTDSFRERVAREDRHLRVAVGPTGTDERADGTDPASNPGGQTDRTGPASDPGEQTDGTGPTGDPEEQAGGTGPASDPNQKADGTDPDDADGVLGYTLSLPDDDDPGLFHLAHVYVDPDRWGEGVGRRLLGDVESLARERGAGRLRLGVLAGNDRAVSFYERAGFERVGGGHDDRLDAANHTYERRLDGG